MDSVEKGMCGIVSAFVLAVVGAGGYSIHKGNQEKRIKEAEQVEMQKQKTAYELRAKSENDLKQQVIDAARQRREFYSTQDLEDITRTAQYTIVETKPEDMDNDGLKDIILTLKDGQVIILYNRSNKVEQK